MKSPLPYCLAALWALPLVVNAGTIHLKDGTTLEGSVLREEGDNYVLLVNVTKNIKDEKIVAKKDVKKIEADKPDLLAFAEIEKLVPVPDLAKGPEYERRIKRVEAFLKEHRGSSKTRVAKEMLETLKSEASRIGGGGVKIRGKIIMPDEYRANAYELDAAVQENAIRTLVAQGRLLDALRRFMIFDRDYRNTAPFRAILPLMRQVVISHNTEAEQSLSTFDKRVEERAAGLARMQPADRAATEKAIEEEDAALETNFKAEKDSKIGWVTPHPFSKSALTETTRYCKQELSRIAKLSSTPFVDGGKAYREAYQAILGASDQGAVKQVMQEVKSARLPATYMEILQAELDKLPAKAKPK